MTSVVESLCIPHSIHVRFVLSRIASVTAWHGCPNRVAICLVADRFVRTTKIASVLKNVYGLPLQVPQPGLVSPGNLDRSQATFFYALNRHCLLRWAKTLLCACATFTFREFWSFSIAFVQLDVQIEACTSIQLFSMGYATETASNTGLSFAAQSAGTTLRSNARNATQPMLALRRQLSFAQLPGRKRRLIRITT
jgi:hypothetical protein